jgi:hypothetical protein
MTTYLSAHAQREIAKAQPVLDHHMRRLNGICRGCGLRKCFDYLEASAVFARYEQLPLRRPYAALMG